VVITATQERLLAAARASARSDEVDFFDLCLQLEMTGWPAQDDVSVIVHAMLTTILTEFGPGHALGVFDRLFTLTADRLSITTELLEHIAWGSIAETSAVLGLNRATLNTYALVLAGRAMDLLPELDLHAAALYALGAPR
jgi:hypothetical protein